MSDNPKEAEKQTEKAIFISADCWLGVFDLLPPSQLGLGIAMISHRFDHYVDEHFKTRRWALANEIRIGGVIGENGSMEIKIINSNGQALPIPQIPLPKKVMAFRSIKILFIDQNVLTFLRHFHRFFASCETTLYIETENIRISEFFVRNIWPMFKDTIRHMHFKPVSFRQMRQFTPSMLNDCPALRAVGFDDGFFPEFPPGDSANATDGQAVAKWVYTPHSDFTKILNIENLAVDQWLTTVEHIKAAFSNASSPVSFGIYIDFPSSSSIDSVLPIELTNGFTKEKLILSQEDEKGFMLVRCPILPDDKRGQQKLKELGKRWNQIKIAFTDDGVDEGLLDGAPGPSGDQKQAEMDLSLD